MNTATDARSESGFDAGQTSHPDDSWEQAVERSRIASLTLLEQLETGEHEFDPALLELAIQAIAANDCDQWAEGNRGEEGDWRETQETPERPARGAEAAGNGSAD